MSGVLRIATWNLERASARDSAKRHRQATNVAEINADVWILTETNAAFGIPEYRSLATQPVPGYHKAGENFSTILVRWPILRQLPTFDPYFAVCAEVESPLGPMIVYGTIITFANDRGSDKTSRRWHEHRQSIERHSADWRKLRAEFPDHAFVVGGDFNQSRDGSGWYEDAQSVKALGEGLEQCGLICATDEDLRKSRKLDTRSTVDHLCLSPGLKRRVQYVGAWEGCDESGKRMSDHNGVYVDLAAT